MVALVGRLIAASPEFRVVAGARRRQVRDPAAPVQPSTAGLLTFEYQLLSPAEWPSLTVAVQLPVPGDDSAQRLAVSHEAF